MLMVSSSLASALFAAVLLLMMIPETRDLLVVFESQPALEADPATEIEVKRLIKSIAERLDLSPTMIQVRRSPVSACGVSLCSSN